MANLTRRDFVKLTGVTGIASLTGLSFSSRSSARSRTLVIGGGFGGATCAHYLKTFDPDMDVTLVEPNKVFVTCPFSNTVLAGLHDMDFITHGYDQLQEKHQVKVIHDSAMDIDAGNRSIALESGGKLEYDQLVVSPGIGFKWGQIQGYDEAATSIMPHAWKAGQQTILLRQQLEAMDDGGVVIIAPSSGPFRAPTAPYERACMIAHYLKKTKPKSKIMIVDANTSFAKQALFMDGWKKVYPGMIEWISGDETGGINRVDTREMQIFPSTGKSFGGSVINIIPPQQANTIALKSGLTDNTGWCPINHRTFESSKHKDIYVLGDACAAGDMPKTAHSASAQAKVCAAAIVSKVHGTQMPEPVYGSSTYSLVAPKYGFSLASVFRLKNNRITFVETGESPRKAPKKIRVKEAKYALGWYLAVTADAFASY